MIKQKLNDELSRQTSRTITRIYDLNFLSAKKTHFMSFVFVFISFDISFILICLAMIEFYTNFIQNIFHHENYLLFFDYFLIYFLFSTFILDGFL